MFVRLYSRAKATATEEPTLPVGPMVIVVISNCNRDLPAGCAVLESVFVGAGKNAFLFCFVFTKIDLAFWKLSKLESFYT
jgi:hypothetical protein